MRLVFRGHFTIAEVEATLVDFLAGLRADDVDFLSGVSLYFSPYSNGLAVTLCNDAGLRIDEIEVRNESRMVMSSSLVRSMNRDDEADPEEEKLCADLAEIRERRREASNRRYAAKIRKKSVNHS